MKKNKKIIFNTVFLLLVFVLTIYGVFHGEDLGDVMEVIENADKCWLLPGIALVAFFIWGESVIIWYMMRSYGIHLKKTSCFLFSSVGFFFSCIPPSASGGQPMQIYYMKKEKVSIPVATVILMICPSAAARNSSIREMSTGLSDSALWTPRRLGEMKGPSR